MSKSIRYNKLLGYGGVSFGLLLMIICFIKDSLLGGIVVACIPLVLLYIYFLLTHPYWGLVTLLIINYFIIPTIRYMHMEGLSVIIESMIVFIFISIIFNTLIYNKIKWRKIYNKVWSEQ